MYTMIDLRSDTLTLPTPEMLQSMTTAPLGDDSRDGDPTVQDLEAEAARLLGKEAAVFTVSGTMSNTLALRTHCEPGAAAIVDEQAHVYNMEWSAMAATCGLLVMPVPAQRGVPDETRVTAALARAAAGFPARGVLCLENTHNAAGGTVMTAEQTARLARRAHDAGVPVHLDGARIFNAAVALGVDVRTLADPADSVSFCLSKGLSAPVGSILAGTAPFIDRARKIRRSFGAAMRQAGVIAAPCLVALRTGVDRLREDHDHARRLAEGLAVVPGLAIDLTTVQTNIVNVDTRGCGVDAATFNRHLMARDVRGLPGMGSRLRLVTYRGITEADITRAITVFGDVVRELGRP
jgi:threonine aldolase